MCRPMQVICRHIRWMFQSVEAMRRPVQVMHRPVELIHVENLTSVIQVYKARATYNASKIGPLTKMQIFLTLIYREK